MNTQPVLEIVIPVYNEGDNIISVLDAFREHVKTHYCVSICYDFDEDNTLEAIRNHDTTGINLKFVKNEGKGALGAVMTGFQHAEAPCVLMMPADDDYNAHRLDEMVRLMLDGNDIVCPSRFMRGGCMKGCPFFKKMLLRVVAVLLRFIACLPTHDPTNGFRMFSRRLLQGVSIESKVGFAYSLELLVKAHRLGLSITQVPVSWFERNHGESRFKILEWAPQYLRWFWYAFGTTYLRRSSDTVEHTLDTEDV